MLPAARMRGPMASPRCDLIAHGDERHQQPVAVAHGGDAVAQLQLRRFEDDLALSGVVFGERLVAFADAAVERQVHVGVDQAGHDELAAGIDRRRASRNRNRRSRTGRRDAAAGHHDHAVADRCAAVAVDDRPARDRNHRGLLRTRAEAKTNAQNCEGRAITHGRHGSLAPAHVHDPAGHRRHDYAHQHYGDLWHHKRMR